MLSVLIIDKDETHAAKLVKAVLPDDTNTTVCSHWKEGLRVLRRIGLPVELVLFCLEGSRQQPIYQLRAMMAACPPAVECTGPRFLCILRAYQGPEIELLIEQLGARIAYE
jgi:hypothetical protein